MLMKKDNRISSRNSAKVGVLLALIGFAGAAQAQTIVDHRRAKWSDPVTLPLVPAAAANLPDGRVITWAANRKTTFEGFGGSTSTSIFDPVQMTATDRSVENTNHDMFCPGTAQLADGRIMVTGGADAGATTFYDPATNQWTSGPRLNITRGYHAMTPLGDGSVFTLGGSWSGGRGGKGGEIWRPGQGWKMLDGISTPSFETDDPEGVYRADNQMWLFEAKDGRVFHAGPARSMHWIDLDGNGSAEFAGFRGRDDAMNGNAVMYDIGKILAVGGSSSYSRQSTASAAAFTIDINNGVNVNRIDNMAFPRTYLNSVVLPSGEVVVLGGMRTARIFSDDGAVLPAEIWNPKSGKWKTLPAMNTPRNYHSVGLLLKDGRVMVGGGGLCNCNVNHTNVEILTPPYLLKADGTPAARPRFFRKINARAALGSDLTVRMNTDTAHDFVLVRTGVVTHSTNNDQRRIPLKIVSRDQSNFTLRIPSNASIVQPGEYFLFALNRKGVPSVAENIRITSGTEVAFRASNRNYVSTANGALRANTDSIGADEVFTVEEASSGPRVAIRSASGDYLSANARGDVTLSDSATGQNKSFVIADRGRNAVSIRSAHNNYVGVNGAGRVRASSNNRGSEETFRMTDLTGRAIARKVTILGSNGRYIIARANGSLDTAGRTVSNNDARLTLVPVRGSLVAIQSSSGQYFSAARDGTIRANKASMGDREQFRLIRNNDGTFALRTHFEDFVSIRPNGNVTAKDDRMSNAAKLRITFD